MVPVHFVILLHFTVSFSGPSPPWSSRAMPAFGRSCPATSLLPASSLEPWDKTSTHDMVGIFFASPEHGAEAVFEWGVLQFHHPCIDVPFSTLNHPAIRGIQPWLWKPIVSDSMELMGSLQRPLESATRVCSWTGNSAFFRENMLEGPTKIHGLSPCSPFV